MTILAATGAHKGTRGYSLHIATEGNQVRAAQALRYKIFAEELGAELHSPEPGLDIDPFDADCDHLLIQAEPAGEVVGTYRMLPPGRRARLYSDGEFDLRGLRQLRPGMVETRRRGGPGRPTRRRSPAPRSRCRRCCAATFVSGLGLRSAAA